VGRLRDGLYRALNAVAPEERIGLRLAGDAWEIDGNGVTADVFFRALPNLVSDGHILVLQGGAHPPELRRFLEPRHIATGERVALGTIWPRPRLFHLRALPDDLHTLASLAESCAGPEVADHVQLYEPGRMVLEWWDAFTAPLYISKRIAVEAVEAFSRGIDRPYTELAHGLPPTQEE
jgi:hypothetical protein